MKATIRTATVLVFVAAFVLCSYAATLNKVAIIGSGIGGASAAHWIHKQFPSAEITVFERSSIVGGRIRSETFNNKTVELGASIIHTSNQHLRSFVQEFSLTESKPEPNRNSRFGLWGGNSFLFESSDFKLLTLYKLFARYGTAPVVSLNKASAVKDQFCNFYKILPRRSFEDSRNFWQAVNLYHYGHEVFSDNLFRSRVEELYTREIISAVMRVNYGQDTFSNALAGYISLIGAESNSLYSIEGGNVQIIQNLLKSSTATIHLVSHVTNITSSNNKYTIHYHRQSSNLESADFDAVIIATPLEIANIDLQNVENLDEEITHIDRKFQTTHTTIVQGNPKASYFGGREGELPGEILTVENEGLMFSSLAEKSKGLYKVFSRAEMTEKEVEKMFGDVEGVKRVEWKAYPVLNPALRGGGDPKFVLAPRLYYVNAVETYASAMEISAMGAYNVVRLMERDFGQN
eukprot:TRINITY_DN15002_c0_g1_i1.p1 TRINITY_DN15002_c0_g1~~TRINITY_DN15002_c0_g1_i1.p1  ORF type:complete len:462 (-),score=84.65 TRINITY_DN15002_c0_g1_i1:60-1445(-)